MIQLFTLVFALMASSLLSPSGVVRGTVTSKEGVLALATIRLENESLLKGSVSDTSGFFEVSGLPGGEFRLTVTRVGFKSYSTQISLADHETLNLDILLHQDRLGLEQLVVSATRSEVPIYEAPVIVSQISNRTFETTQSLALSEGLSFSPGLRVENNCQNCGFTQLRMNGLDGPYTQILINSRPVFSALAGVYGLDMIPANMVDRIEVVKGGGSALYGGNAIAGTVNIITKDPVENSFEIGLNQGYSFLEEPDRTISFNGSLVSEDLNKGVSIYGYNRQRDPWDANGDGFSEITLLENATVGFDAFWNTSDRSKIKLNGYSINEFRRGGNRFDLAPHQTDITEQLDHNILGGGISFEALSTNLRHRFSVYTSGQFTDRNSYYGGGGRIIQLGDELTEDDLIAINAYGNSRDISLVSGFQYNYEPKGGYVITLGSEFQYNDVTDEMPGYERIIDQRVQVAGNYAQLEWDPCERLCIVAGGRLDVVNISGRYNLVSSQLGNDERFVVAIPRLAVLYNLSEHLRWRTSFAQGYRGPQAFNEDLHIETVGGAALFVQLNPDLETESSNSLTSSLNYSNYLGSRQFNFVVEGFFTRLQNPFIFADQSELSNGVAVISKRNGDAAEVQGVNLEASMAFNGDLIIQSGFTFQTARYSSPEEIWSPEDPGSSQEATVVSNLLRTPNTYGFFSLAYTPSSAWELSWSGVFTGAMDVAHVIDPVTEFTVVRRTPNFFENNLKVAYTLHLDYGIEFFGGIQNMFNSFQTDFDRGADRDAGYVFGPTRPRSVYAGMKLMF